MAIPWSKLLSMSPTIVEGGRVLWKAVSQRQPRVPPAAPPQERAAAVEVRVDTLERRVAQLGEEASASFEVVKSITQEHSRLAEHHAELVNAVDALLARTRVLVWLCGTLALALVAVLGLLATLLASR
jgi:hypothetical protein